MRRMALLVVLLVLASGCHRIQPGRQLTLTTKILDRPVATQAQAQQWAAENGAGFGYRPLIADWRAIARARGVRPDVAFAQSAKETDFGNFGGVVDWSFRNPCGLKTTQGGPNEDPNAHARFPDWRTGITACVDHLALYAGHWGYPRADSPDPRHFGYLHGTAPTVQQLGGRWAPNPDYGNSIVNGYLLHMIFD